MGKASFIIWVGDPGQSATGIAKMRSLDVLLVEDSTLFRAALANVFSRNKMLNLTVCSSKLLVSRKANIGEELVVIDAVTWGAGQRTLVDAVRRVSIVTPVILLGREDLLDRHLEALQAGAVGFVKQTASQQEFIKAVRAVAKGEVWFEKKLFRNIFGQPGGWPRRLQLNENEQKVLALVASGKSNKEIGTSLGLTERTIKGYVSNLFRKIGVSNRSGLTSYAIMHEMTLLTPDQL